MARIGRLHHSIDVSEPLLKMQRDRVLVTGAAGAIGYPLTQKLREFGVEVVPTDIDTARPWGCSFMDVTDFDNVLEVVRFHEPTVILHLAAAKHAPQGELDPYTTSAVNITGTKNIVDCAGHARVVLASTCKAIAPETAYGASKLVAERMVLNAGGSVARFFNVPDSGGGNVMDIWNAVPVDQPLPVVTSCARYFITLEEAVALILWSAIFPAGRYMVDAGEPLTMSLFASLNFPERSIAPIAPRRGDRLSEPYKGTNEWIAATRVRWIDRVESWHDGLSV